MEIKTIFKNGEIVNQELYNELIRVNKELIPEWNMKVGLSKILELQKIDEVYNAYVFYDKDILIGFGLILNEDGEDDKCSNIKNIFQRSEDDVYWLADYFIYPEHRNKGYGTKCFEELCNITKNKDFYLYTSVDNIANRIYSKFMKNIGVFEDRKNIYLREVKK